MYQAYSDGFCKPNPGIMGIGGIKSTMFSGEGLVLNVTGPGKLITQTRSPAGFLSWVGAHVGGRGRGR